MTQRSLRAFLCYFPDDLPEVHHLHSRLKSEGFDVWLDSDLLPGKVLGTGIRTAIQQSDVVIVCLSASSTRQRGHLHRQIGQALDIAEEQPPETIFLIPARLDACEIPERLTAWQRVDLFEPNGYDLLVKALTHRSQTIDRTSEVNKPASPYYAANYKSTLHANISLGHVPIPADPEIFVGRSPQVEWLNQAFKDPNVDIVQIVADGGVGKSTLVWHWLEQRRQEGYNGIYQAIDWSFYSQGKRDYETDSHAFLDYAAEHFAPYGIFLPEKSARSPEQVGNQIGQVFVRTGGLIVLDGLEPLQYPPHVSSGALKDAGLVAFLRTVRSAPPVSPESSARLVIITTRWLIPQLRGRAVLTIDLDNLSEKDGAELLYRFRLPSAPTRAVHIGAVPDPARLHLELRKVSREYNGHALALLLLASFVLRHYGGDIRNRNDLNLSLDDSSNDDPYRHARRVMQSYARMFADSTSTLDKACRQVLFLVGLFDRPVRLRLLDVVRAGEPIAELTDDLTDHFFNLALEELRVLRLLSHIPNYVNEQLETHPLIREHFGQTFRYRYPNYWSQAHLRLFNYLCDSSVEYPDTVEGLEPLLQAVAHGCEAGLYRESYLEVYRRRIMRGEEAFASVKLGLVAPIVTCLSHFFKPGRWNELITSGAPGSVLTEQDQLSLLLEAGSYLTAVKGYATSEVKQVYDAAVVFCKRLDKHRELMASYHGLWRFALVRGDCAITSKHAQELAALAAGTSDPLEGMIAARVQGTTDYYMGRFQSALRHTEEGVRLYKEHAQETSSKLGTELLIICLSVSALSLWHLGYPEQALLRSAESLTLARNLDSSHTLAMALLFDTWLQQFVSDVQSAGQRAEEMCNLCEERGLGSMAYLGMAMHSWANTRLYNDERYIEDFKEALTGWRQSGSGLIAPYCLYRMAECYWILNKTSIAMDLLDEAITMSEGRQERWWVPEFYRLRALLRCMLKVEPKLITDDLQVCIEKAVENHSLGHLRRGLDSAEVLNRDCGIKLSAPLLAAARDVLLKPQPAPSDLSS